MCVDRNHFPDVAQGDFWPQFQYEAVYSNTFRILPEAEMARLSTARGARELSPERFN
jgi:hypothetical protein